MPSETPPLRRVSSTTRTRPVAFGLAQQIVHPASARSNAGPPRGRSRTPRSRCSRAATRRDIRTPLAKVTIVRSRAVAVGFGLPQRHVLAPRGRRAAMNCPSPCFDADPACCTARWVPRTRTDHSIHACGRNAGSHHRRRRQGHWTGRRDDEPGNVAEDRNRVVVVEVTAEPRLVGVGRRCGRPSGCETVSCEKN